MKKNRLSSGKAAYALALAGISAALALLFVWLGVVLRYVTVAMFVAAGCAVAVPMLKKYYVSSLLAYVVSAGLSFLIGDVAAVAGYAVYFGPMALISVFMNEKRVKPFITYPVKIVIINAALAVLYFALKAIGFMAPDLADKFPYWAIALAGTAILLVVDVFVLYLMKGIRAALSKVLRDKYADRVTEDEIAAQDAAEMNPFDDEEEHSPKSGVGKECGEAKSPFDDAECGDCFSDAKDSSDGDDGEDSSDEKQ